MRFADAHDPTAGSNLCAAAPKSTLFIVGGAIAGCGSGAAIKGASGITGIIMPLPERPLHFGIVVSVFGFATCFGPIMGAVRSCELEMVFLDVSSPFQKRSLRAGAKEPSIVTFLSEALLASWCGSLSDLTRQTTRTDNSHSGLDYSTWTLSGLLH